jgi:DNA-binding FrmR family transcriptional regulator
MTILQQIASIRGAANGLMGEMVEIHLQDELVSGETTPDQRAARMAEVGHLLRSYLK